MKTALDQNLDVQLDNQVGEEARSNDGVFAVIKEFSSQFTNLSGTNSQSEIQQLFLNRIDGPSVAQKERWLCSKEAAEYLRIPLGTLRNMTSNGQIPYYKLGRLNRYLESELRELLLGSKRGA